MQFLEKLPKEFHYCKLTQWINVQNNILVFNQANEKKSNFIGILYM